MHYQGIVPLRPFPVGRRLNEQDQAYRLLQGSRIETSEPYSDLSVIKLNSTYLELVDKYYLGKGWMTLMANGIAVMMILFGLWFLTFGFEKAAAGDSAGAISGALAALLLWLVSAVGIWLARFEWAYYTHYPIRLNRQTKMVHVFRKDGTVLNIPWDEVFFTLDHDARYWEIRGHVLKADGETVKETFALGTFSAFNRGEGLRKLHAHWEFFRRYMEEGPEAVAGYVKQALPINRKRESFRVGYEVLATGYRHPNPILSLIGWIQWPLLALSSVGRWVAMRISRVPEWPEEIEAVNQVALDDPYDIDARINPPELR